MLRTRTRGFRLWDRTGTVLINGLAWLLLLVYLFPMGTMLVTSLMEEKQLIDGQAPLWPARAKTYMHEGKEVLIYRVPLPEGERELALVAARRNDADFIDPANPGAGSLNWKGRWRTLKKVYEPRATLANFVHMWKAAEFPLLLRNTLVVAFLGELAVLTTSILVAYGLARFRIPGEPVILGLIVATMILPEKITLVPTYFLFVRVLDWDGSWLPLLLPHLFGNALLIFLLRQNFRGLPRELDEAAELDGAGPLRTLYSIILPQSVPVLVTGGLLHFFYAWNETRLQSLYLPSRPDLHTIAFAVQQYQSLLPQVNVLQASALMTMAAPVIVLFLAQRLFMHNVVITGSEKRKS